MIKWHYKVWMKRGGKREMKFSNQKFNGIFPTLLILLIFILSGCIYFNIFRIWVIWIKSNSYFFKIRILYI